jgi:acyl dehydratase
MLRKPTRCRSLARRHRDPRAGSKRAQTFGNLICKTDNRLAAATTMERDMDAADSSTPPGLVTDIAGLPALAGSPLGQTEWRQMTQERVDAFADVTEDHNFIHVDPERARATPFGGTIAHGYLTLSLLAPVTQQLLQISDAAVSINYGLDRVRFPAPLPVGAYFRGSATIGEVTTLDGGVQVKVTATIEVRDAPKPALVAECIFRYYA